VVEALDDGDEDAEPEDLETVQPAGDLDIFADLGVAAMEISAICSDLDQYPDEMLAQISSRIGFGPQFDRAVEAEEF
jgi:putative tRNA adenosine deaminase-associated protein